ncbi:NAD(P)-dependent oxidoreductase [Kibdelosporangium philippinense]|uniref:NAD(P)-dependent oxidoreductase n=1 Tax=Kibdelosporangium philippinense TaxID=211113 RepID=UPI0036234D71
MHPTRRVVANTPDVLTEGDRGPRWALILACVRRIAEGDRFSGRKPMDLGPRMMLGHELYGRTLGIVGYGRIGKATAKRAEGFGMRVIHNSRSGGVPFETLIAESDVVSIHAPLTPETKHLFNADVFKNMKSTAVLVNTARGPLVDEAALAHALRTNEIFAAGLDVFEREPQVEKALLDLDNVTIVPHLGSATVQTRAAMGLFAVENLLNGIAGHRPRALVNPEVLT